nr:aldo/keto reductase [Lysinibacter cavernae]
MPRIGFGVFQIGNDETAAAVRTAIDAGYRSIDTAAIYGNEVGTGVGIAESGVDRGELFVTSKLWHDDHGFDNTLRAYDASLERLGVDALDLFLIHWPVPTLDRYVDSWRALERLLSDGRVGAIGVSNFQQPHLERLIAETGTVPAVNQIELHPGLQQRELSAFHAANGIITEAWSPLGQGTFLSHPALSEIARAHQVTEAQVVLRWHVQADRVVIPKSTHPARITSNLDVFSFELGAADIAIIDNLETPDEAGRIGPHPDTFAG